MLGVSDRYTERDGPLSVTESHVMSHGVACDARCINDLLGFGAIEVACDRVDLRQIDHLTRRVVHGLRQKSVVDEPLNRGTHDHAVEHGSEALAIKALWGRSDADELGGRPRGKHLDVGLGDRVVRFVDDNEVRSGYSIQAPC